MDEHGPPVAAPASLGSRWWYYVVTIGTAGLFAWVPFLHAATRLKTAYARWLAGIFGALDVVIYVLLGMTPTDGQGNASGGTISFLGGLLALGTVIGGCTLLASLRRPAEPPQLDPAVRTALAARARRAEARKLAANDPLLARELRIGRPDLTRDYDDGGLVDLNNAPASAIAEVCGVPGEVADAIVAARAGSAFSNIDELFVLAEVPVEQWDRIRDRAVLIG
ncbi:helix-hairpin-helix domain-containing protein [Amycolatopsis sp. K13G38]|uniref:Helix-hairpin-helix domain-containing protein n=1 Tax=Amycolatopsis acididurans TaxID=2724524 RepID=A0ABX1JHQ1_9PSEU|nr:helix-hairpin-helix domain-containing protein [Amycolatopsis acididurans]NKQ58096.1 helix-hairpin-helix domain-containing protein [Amycolatopsis acididurans]